MSCLARFYPAAEVVRTTTSTDAIHVRHPETAVHRRADGPPMDRRLLISGPTIPTTTQKAADPEKENWHFTSATHPRYKRRNEETVQIARNLLCEQNIN